MLAFFRRVIDGQAEWLARSLYSRWGYVLLVYGSILWVPLVVFSIDDHGFLYLYIATSLSLVTQVPLAMLARKAAQEAMHADTMSRQILENMLSTMEAVHALVQSVRSEMESQEDLLESLAEHRHEVEGCESP